MDKIKVLIIEDHPLMREALRDILETCVEYEIIGEAEDGRRGVEMVSEMQPDVVLLDLSLPEIDGIHAMRTILETRPQTRIFVLTSSTNDNDALEAIRSGASGYLTKDAPLKQIRDGLGEVARGKEYIPFETGERLARALKQGKTVSSQLTSRENEILILVGEGYTNYDIANKCNLSEGTVRVHVSNILRKLELKNRSQAALFATKKASEK